ncbi:hypothetical protein M427DRAFT_401529 [Gonapodya prolifera JEL478]|uniref:Uncharacterized protein n=1 Tax=Gonapodya prolifera (strain JEL478) TaxID=1344416 RepID=A0A139ATQ4_GONPJ|nr:hypothetical protein M427DRAFT_401529 [Gonapodya prolifera JEL478]|eukprot:KXS20074.1 hypothetical protein M427DRAFT_401529 [Gonapodya prolifera JEL478]
MCSHLVPSTIKGVPVGAQPIPSSPVPILTTPISPLSSHMSISPPFPSSPLSPTARVGCYPLFGQTPSLPFTPGSPYGVPQLTNSSYGFSSPFSSPSQEISHRGQIHHQPYDVAYAIPTANSLQGPVGYHNQPLFSRQGSQPLSGYQGQLSPLPQMSNVDVTDSGVVAPHSTVPIYRKGPRQDQLLHHQPLPFHHPKEHSPGYPGSHQPIVGASGHTSAPPSFRFGSTAHGTAHQNALGARFGSSKSSGYQHK